MRTWGLRSRLIVAILAVALVVLVGSFVALHELTGAEIRSGIDERLAADLSEFEASPAARAESSAELQRESRLFIEAQGYHADSRIFLIEAGERSITNEEQLLDRHDDEGQEGESDEEREEAESAESSILATENGYSTVGIEDEGEIRVLTSPIDSPQGRIGTFHVAESLEPAGFAQGSLRDTLLITGAIAIGILIAAAAWIATVVARPLQKMAGFASGVDPADMGERLDEDRGPAEVRTLAVAFNGMLDRVQRSFRREREFVADASHELRTPVTVAQGELDLLRRRSSGEDLERIDVARRELKRMERLVTDMLLLATADAPGGLSLREVSLADLLDDLERDLPLLGDRQYEVVGTGGSLVVDEDRLTQVLRNLARNAVTHTSVGGRISIEVEARGTRIRFTVSDDGPGIPAAEAGHLFDRFYRTEESKERDGSGRGLGLAIAAAIVEAHGGSIWAEPGTDGGRVIFELPGWSSQATGEPG